MYHGFLVAKINLRMLVFLCCDCVHKAMVLDLILAMQRAFFFIATTLPFVTPKTDIQPFPMKNWRPGNMTTQGDKPRRGAHTHTHMCTHMYSHMHTHKHTHMHAESTKEEMGLDSDDGSGSTQSGECSYCVLKPHSFAP